MTRLLILTLLCGAAAVAQLTTYQPAFSATVQIKPQAVPTSLTTVTTYDASLIGLTVTNTTGGAVTVTVQDRQSSPIAFMSSVSIAANTTYVVAIPFGWYAPRGWSIQASGEGLTFHAVWKQ